MAQTIKINDTVVELDDNVQLEIANGIVKISSKSKQPPTEFPIHYTWMPFIIDPEVTTLSGTITSSDTEKWHIWNRESEDKVFLQE